MPTLRNRKTGIDYDVTQDDLVKIMASSTWGKVYTEVKEPQKTEIPKEVKKQEDEPKEVKKTTKRKKGDE